MLKLSILFFILIRFGFFQFFRSNGFYIHFPPEVGDVGHHKWDDERNDGHAGQGELARRTVLKRERTLQVGIRWIVGCTVVAN